MKKLFYLAFAFMMTLSIPGMADEGMWLPSLIGKLNYADMEKLGCKLTAEEIYSINHSSMKDAIFQLMNTENGQTRGFCTGEIISKEGLLLTNHHCGFDAISKLSSVEHDYLTDGFWAYSKAEELAAENLAVSRVVRIEDVTAKVTANVTEDMDEATRTETIRKEYEALEAAATEGTHYTARVKEMFEGNDFYLFVYEIFNDVRLVGAPPSSIGKFGGDTDNWMWPRHTGDFSMFRVYTDKEGKPAEYSKDNVPYNPLHVLPISIKGVEENDYAMIMGYPGSTDRYMSSYGMEYKRTVYNPVLIKLYGKKLEVMKEAMNADDEIRINFASDYASSANGYKLYKGEAKNLTQTDAIAQREALEAEFTKWVNADAKRKEMYGNVLPGLKKIHQELKDPFTHIVYANLGLAQSSKMIANTYPTFAYIEFFADKKANADKITAHTEALKANLDEMYKNYYPEVDKDIFVAMLTMYYNDIAAEKRNAFFNEVILKKFKADTPEESIQKFADEVYAKSIFTDKARFAKFLEKPSVKELNKDLLIQFTRSIQTQIYQDIRPGYMAASENQDKYNRLFIKGLREMQADKSFYPDANSTLRLTYGQVKSYDPYDGAHYKHQTFIEGILAKKDNNNPEFIVPEKLVKIIKDKDFGQYADSNGRMPVAFLTTNDITGGNSGSPVINGKGELIGCAFDGNWEWLTGNLIYNLEMQRTICADIRYILLIVDKYAGATNLIEEMNIVK